jgi:hypothetical protein
MSETTLEKLCTYNWLSAWIRSKSTESGRVEVLSVNVSSSFAPLYQGSRSQRPLTDPHQLLKDWIFDCSDEAPNRGELD